MRMLTVFLDLQRRNKNSNLDLLQTPLTLPASRKANPHCMMKIMMLMTTRKSASSSAASTCSWSKSSRVWLARTSKCFWSTDSKSKSDMVVDTQTGHTTPETSENELGGQIWIATALLKSSQSHLLDASAPYGGWFVQNGPRRVLMVHGWSTRSPPDPWWIQLDHRT